LPIRCDAGTMLTVSDDTESFADEAGTRIVSIAQAMVARETGLIEGCRLLLPWIRVANIDVRDDPDACMIWLFESETDHYPVGDVRSLWSKAALAESDHWMNLCIAKGERDVIDACHGLIQKCSPAQPE